MLTPFKLPPFLPPSLPLSLLSFLPSPAKSVVHIQWYSLMCTYHDLDNDPHLGPCPMMCVCIYAVIHILHCFYNYPAFCNAPISYWMLSWLNFKRHNLTMHHFFSFYSETFMLFKFRINVQNQFAKASLWPVFRIIFLLKFLTILDALLSLLIEMNRLRNGIKLDAVCCI